MEAEKECSEFANALLSLRMGSSYPPADYSSADDQGDNDTVLSGDYDRTSRMGVFMNAIKGHSSSSWSSPDFASTYGFVNHSKQTGRKRVHVTISTTSSESNDSYDLENLRESYIEKSVPTGLSAGEKPSKVQRGRYRCSLCGAFKTNHVCALVTDKLMCSVGTQSFNSRSLLTANSNIVDVLSGSDLSSQSYDQKGDTDRSVVSGKPSHPSLVPLASVHGTPAHAITKDASDVTGCFQERIVTVSRNRRSIQTPTLPTGLEPAQPTELPTSVSVLCAPKAVASRAMVDEDSAVATTSCDERTVLPSPKHHKSRCNSSAGNGSVPAKAVYSNTTFPSSSSTTFPASGSSSSSYPFNAPLPQALHQFESIQRLQHLQHMQKMQQMQHQHQQMIASRYETLPMSLSMSAPMPMNMGPHSSASSCPSALTHVSSMQLPPYMHPQSDPAPSPLSLPATLQQRDLTPLLHTLPETKLPGKAPSLIYPSALDLLGQAI